MKKRAVDLAGSTEPKHVVTASVAVVITVLALSYGGYGTDTLALLSVACWTVILAGLGFRFFPRTRLTTPSWVLLGLLAALTAWTALSISWSNDAGLAYIRAIQVATALGIATIVILASKPGEGRAWISGLTIGLGVIVALAAFSRFIPVIGNDAELTQQLGPIMGGRLSWPLGYWNALGLVVAMFMALCLWHAGTAGRERLRDSAVASLPLMAVLLYLCSSRGSVVAAVIGVLILFALDPHRRACAASIILGVAGSIPLVLLASRLDEVVHAGTGGDAVVQGLILLASTVVVCTVVGWARVPVLRRIESADLNQRTAFRVALGIAVVALIVLITSNPTDRISSFTSIPVNGVETDDSTYATQHLLSESGNGRWQLWETSLDAFREEPVRGIGSGGFEAYFKVNGSFWMKTIDPHSTPLEFLAELGLVGFLLLVGAAGFAFVAGIRRYRSLGVSLNSAERDGTSRQEMGLFFALLAIGVFGVSIDWTGELPVISGALMLFLAALAGPLYAVPARERRRAGSAVVPVVAVVASMLVAGVIIVASARQYEASQSIESSRTAFEDGDGRKALDEAEQAVSATPFAAATYAQLAAVQEKTGNLGGALASAEEATVRASKNDEYWLLLGNMQARDGLTTSAFLSLLTAQSLNPNSAYWTKKNIAKRARAASAAAAESEAVGEIE